MTVEMEEDTRKLYYLTVGEPFTETNSKKYVENERYRNFISNSFYFVFIWKEHFLPGAVFNLSNYYIISRFKLLTFEIIIFTFGHLARRLKTI
jgi:hypothetical protein